MGYIFDTNIFIRSKNEMPADVWTTLWARLHELIISGKIHTSIKVKEEIDKGNDDLTIWMKHNATPSFYLPIDNLVLRKYAQLQEWANNTNQYTTNALHTFAEVGDAYIIATAAVKDFTLVTFETSAPNSKKSVKIPDVCNVFGVRWCDLTTAFRELGVTI